MTPDERADEELSFSSAMEQLEGILKGIEDEEIDIDVLGRELERAAGLLELCREKIRRAEVEVTQIVQSLEETAAEDEREEQESEEPEAVPEPDESGEEELPF